MRKLLFSLAALLVVAGPAHAQKTKAQISSEITTLFPDNAAGLITPLGLRTVTNDLAISIMPTAPVTAGNLTCFDGTTGLLKDCALAPPISAVVGVNDIQTLTNKTLTAPILGGMVDFSAAFKFSVQSGPAQITANQNNYNPSSVICATSSTLLINSDAARDITGLGGGVAGCKLHIVNNGNFIITLKEDSASSSAGNRLKVGGDIALAASQGVTLLYDGVASRWRNPSSITGAGSGTVTSAAVAAGYGISASGTCTITTTGTCTVAANLSTASNCLGANVSLNNISNYFDGPSMAQGTTGTWWASGTLTLNDTSVSASNFYCKLWDGVSVISSGNAIHNAAANNRTTITLSGFLASPAANIKISCRNVDSTSATIEFNRTGDSKDACIYGMRIQ